MPRHLSRSWVALTAVVAPFVLLGVLHLNPSLDVTFEAKHLHLVLVSIISACALAVAGFAALAGARARQHGPVWLAVGCLIVGALMVGHGLVTPGVANQPVNTWVGRFPYVALLGFAIALGLASQPRNRPSARLATNYPGPVLLVVGAVLFAAAASLIGHPHGLAGDRTLPGENTAKWVITLCGCYLLIPLAATHWRRWRLGHDPVQYSLVLASSMSAAALIALRFGDLWRLSWWDYHGFLLAGFSGAVYAVFVRYWRTRAVVGVLSATFESDPMAHIVGGYPDDLKTLVRVVEAKDHYTHGHSQRTAAFAVQMGVRMGLDEDALRALARGAYLHDVGKIAIPDAILNKPGSLTADERRVIETHPVVGCELVRPSASLAEALPVVLHHHERWDGTGYPEGLTGTSIPLTARITAVADVWDALTSDRSYRPGWAPEEAIAHIQAGRGTHFDPVAVDALVGVAADLGYTPIGAGDDDVAVAAMESCHEVADTSA